MVLAKATALEVARFEFTHRSLGSRTLTLLFDAMPAPVETFSSLESEISLVHDPNRKLRSKLKEQFLALTQFTKEPRVLDGDDGLGSEVCR